MRILTPKSSQYEWIDLDDETGDLTIKFKAGGCYRYTGPQLQNGEPAENGKTLAEHFAVLLKNNEEKDFSVGSYCIRHIIGNAKNRPYEYEKLPEAASV